jgi:putative ABC transport system substrate-binding protein
MRRRDFTIGLLLASTAVALAQEPAKQHRIAIVVPAGPIAAVSDTGSDPIRRREYQAFFEELRRLGDVEGQNLTIQRYSGEGRREAYADLAREVVGENPEAIVAHTNPVAKALRVSSRGLRYKTHSCPEISGDPYNKPRRYNRGGS